MGYTMINVGDIGSYGFHYISTLLTHAYLYLSTISNAKQLQAAWHFYYAYSLFHYSYT